MVSRTMTVTFAAALVVGAYAGCGDGGGSSLPTLGSGGYHTGAGGPAMGSGDTPGSPGASAGSGTGSGSSSGASGSSSGSGSGSSSGAAADAGSTPTPEAAPPPLTLDQAMQQFAACMSYSDFTDTSSNPSGYAAADIAKAQTTRYGDCNACHNSGDGGFWASWGQVQGQDMTMVMFQNTQQFPYIAKWVTGTVDQNGNFKDLQPSNAIPNQSVLASQCQQGTPCHPQFQLDPDLVTAMNAFVSTTITKWHNHACSGSIPPADAGAE